MTLIVDSIAHLLVDGLCAATLFGRLSENENFAIMVLLYNTLAFTTQAFVGLITDKYRGSLAHFQAIACAVVISGFVLPVPAVLKVTLVGLGNSLFHVAGGTRTLCGSGGKAWQLGVFVAPGCVGLALGTLYPSLGMAFALLLALCGVVTALFRPKMPKESEGKGSISASVVVILALAVAIRAFGSSMVTYSWKTTGALTLVMTAFVFSGKTIGGFVCDRVGAKWAAILTVPLAAVAIGFFPSVMAAALVGQLLLNMTMPITLLLLYRAMPESPGFAFGLAASALWPGTIAARLIPAGTPGAVVFACVAFGLAAILLAERKMKGKEDEKLTVKAS